MGVAAYTCPEIFELTPRDFHILGTMNPNPRALLADYVLGLFFSGVTPTPLESDLGALTKVAK